MTSLACDIVILPSEDLAQKLIAASGALRTEPVLFILDGIQFYPHASLYMTQLKLDDMDKVKKLLAAIARNFAPHAFTAVRYNQEAGYVDAEYGRTAALDRLQMAVIDAINPIRDGLREKDEVRLQSAIGVARQNLERYGYQAIGELFRPHATITRFAHDGRADMSLLPEPAALSGHFTRIGLFEMGDNGTCIREIASFTLG